MAGLLTAKVAGLLARPNNKRGLLDGLIAQQVPDQAQQQRQALMAPQTDAPRERVSPLRVLDRVLGGQTITEGLDAERVRLQAEANQPNQAQLMESIAATIQDPRELALFRADPETWAKNVGQQFAPQVVAAGAGQFIGGRMVGEMPTFTESGDTVLRRDSTGITPAYTRTTPSISEGIAQQNADSSLLTAQRPITLSPGETAVTPSGSRLATGAPRVFSASEGSDLVTDSGQQIYSNDRAPDPNANQAAQATVRSLESDVFPVLDRQEQLLQSGDVITGIGADARMVAARAQAALGDATARRQVAATEEYIANAGRLRVGMARSLGANPSNADIQLLETVTAGNINASPQGLLATISQGRQLAERQRDAARSAGAPPAAIAQGGVPMARTPQEAAALPPGTRYRTPDGQEYIR